jgi:hypothetical protein
MDLYRTSESGLVAVEQLGGDETAGLAAALLRGEGGTLGAEDVLFVTTGAGDGTATALALDAEGSVVVVGAADGEVGSDAVTDALQSASAAADRPYEALDDRYDGDGSLRDAHADYFDREPLAPTAFNDDQRVRLLGTAFADDALDLANFLSDRELSVDAVRVEAFGAPESDEFLVRFPSDDDTDEQEAETAVPADGPEAAEGDDQWVAGESADGGPTAVDTATGAGEREGTDGSDPDGTVEPGTAATSTEHDPALADERAGDEGEDGDPSVADDDPETEADAGEEVELPALLEAVAADVQDRLAGTFDADPGSLVSVERGNELLVRPDHPAYAGGVLRYRLRVQPEGTVEFEVNIYGGSEAEKEQMRAVIRENEAAIEEELGYEVADSYDGFRAERTFGSFDQVAAAEIVDEFDRLVRFFDPRVMRA